jgi:hypothetical protein
LPFSKTPPTSSDDVKDQFVAGVIEIKEELVHIISKINLKEKDENSYPRD